MRKLFCVLLAIAVLASLAMPVLAEENLFIPSYGLEATKAVLNGEDVLDCVTVTSVTEAKEKSTDISQEERDLLVEVYNALSDGTMKLPVEGEFVYVELMDVSFALENCRDREDHEHEAASLTVDFELEIENHSGLIVLTYIDEKWEQVKSAVVKDGVLTATFEDICPVVILAPEGKSQSESQYPLLFSKFVPSISYKDGPGIKNAEMDGQGVDACVIVTTIAQAKEKSTDISQDDRDLLLEVYEKLQDGSMKLPLKGDYVIRELVDVSFEFDDCRQIEEHGHKDQNLEQEGVTLTADFNLNIGKEENLIVLTYVDGEWIQVEKVTNNGNGTVKCVFEDVCPVAFVVGADSSADKPATDNPATGDLARNQMIFIGSLMGLSAAGIFALVSSKARKTK